ncbi:CHASE domain-containing protein [Candidatus Magnetaquicoccus inordinatus]|uniref:CHASE domain-containing protein n=1 Tax=Candidatus Magnetaquicoccus inordinatus TaxID=2496818 RepID=UPI00102D1FB3|nr:CHASE domain-containing protein [Candidatus Magnetaquicoccus inordinatus]
MLQISLLAAGQAAAQEPRKVVNVSILRDFPPLSVVNAEGKASGFAVELLEALSANLQWSVRYHVVDNWQEAVAAVRNGVADLSPAVAITAQWEKEFLFSEPLLTTTVSCFVGKDQNKITSCDDLTGRSIAAIQQGAAAQQLSKRTDLKLFPAQNLETALSALLNNQVELLIAPQNTVLTKVQAMGLSRSIHLVGNPFLEIKRAVLLSRERADWLDSLNAAIMFWKGGGAYNALYQRYYGSEAHTEIPASSNKKESKKEGEQNIAWVLGSAAMLLLLLPWMLRRQLPPWLHFRLPLTFGNYFLRKETAWIVLLIAGLVTVIYWHLSKLSLENRTHDRIEYAVEEARQAISKRMMEYEQVLRSGVALFNASRAQVDRRLWHDFVATLQIDTYWPGIQGIGFSRMIPAAELESHTQEIRQEGFPHYGVRPPGERSLYSSIIYLEPFRDRNLRAFGYDMFSEPIRRQAMEQARDYGQASLSGPVKLVQETSTDVQTGFLMYLPVYRPGVALDTLERRRTALLGFVYSPFRTKDLMQGILGHGIPDMDFELFDGQELLEENRLYSSAGNNPAEMLYASSLYNVSRQIVILGRTWTVLFHSRPEFEQKLSSNQPSMVLALGSFIDLLLFILFRFLARRQEQVQREAKRISQQLQQSEVRYQQLVENIHDVIFQTDREGCWQFLNPAWEEVSGFTVAESLQQPFLHYTHPDYHEPLLRQFEDLLAGRISHYRDEVLGVRRDGTQVWVELYTGARLDEMGLVVGSFGTIRDVSARRLAEEAANSAREAAEAANRAKSEFLANMSHELRTPRNSMLILSRLLANDASLSDEQQDSARVVYESGSDLLRLINDILDLSKVEAGRMDVSAAPMSLRSLMESLQRQFRPVALQRRVQWSQSLAHDLSESLTTDALKVEQILRNLLGNAFKFTERGGVHLAIERVDSQQPLQRSELQGQPCVALRVKDSGIGIPEEKFALIFESFQQVESTTSRKYGGTGLGLTIARRFAALLGGEIHLHSRVGEGSQFTLILPLAFPFPEKIIATTSDPVVRRGQSGVVDFYHPALQLLIVDDDERNRLALQRGLSGRTGKLYFAVDGEEALQVLQEHPEIHLLLMDIMMPRMDGYQAMQAIRRQPRFAQLPIIALTAKAMPGDRERCLHAGANDYLAKPVALEQLYAILHEWLSPLALPEPHSLQQEECRVLLPKQPEIIPAKEDLVPLLVQGEEVAILLVGSDIRRSFALAKILQHRTAKVHIASNRKHLLQLLQEAWPVHLLVADFSSPCLTHFG